MENALDTSCKAASSSSQIVTPFEVVAGEDGVDYDSLIKDFGTQKISDELICRFKKATGRTPHPLLRRGLYFSHRDLENILDLVEQKKPFYLYTGRGPTSDAMHIGHMIPFIFTQQLQETFNCPLVVQIADDEKYFQKDLSLEEIRKLALENIKDIISFGFDITKTFIFNNTEYISEMYENVCKIQKRVTFNSVRAIFGLNDSSNCGKVSYPSIQAAPCFSSSFKKLFGLQKIPCLVPCAIDQDPYFRMTRDVAPRMGEIKPSLIHCKFISGLQGSNTKMSSSIPSSAIFLDDSAKTIRKKINSSFSGGQPTRELQKKYGANTKNDVAFQYLKFFLEDDKQLETIKTDYESGKLESGDVKKVLIETLTPIIQTIQKNREEVDDSIVDAFMSIRKLNMTS